MLEDDEQRREKVTGGNRENSGEEDKGRRVRIRVRITRNPYLQQPVTQSSATRTSAVQSNPQPSPRRLQIHYLHPNPRPSLISFCPQMPNIRDPIQNLKSPWPNNVSTWFTTRGQPKPTTCDPCLDQGPTCTRIAS